MNALKIFEGKKEKVSLIKLNEESVAVAYYHGETEEYQQTDFPTELKHLAEELYTEYASAISKQDNGFKF